MKHFSFLHLAAVVTLMGAAVVSCNKDENPAVQDLPGKTFSISITEQRDKATFDWSVSGGKTVNPKETIQELCVTAYNTVTLSTGGVEVNVSSSDPTVVGIEKVGSGSSSYRLVYKGGSGDNAKVGLVTIKVWNGTGTAEIAQRFTVKGLEFVDVEGLRFTYGGEPLVVKHVATSRPKMYCTEGDQYPDFTMRPKQGDYTWMQFSKPDIWVSVPHPTIVNYGYYTLDTTQGALFRFEGLEPENTSFRTVLAFESEWDYCCNKTANLVAQGFFEEGMYADWPNERNVNKDVSDYAGREIWMVGPWACTYTACLQVKTNKGNKYLILYHGQETGE